MASARCARLCGPATFIILIAVLGRGASSTVFSVFNVLLLRPLPFHEPQNLYRMKNGYGPGLFGETTQVNARWNLGELHAERHRGHLQLLTGGNSKLTGAGEAERLTWRGSPCHTELLSLAPSAAGGWPQLYGGGGQVQRPTGHPLEATPPGNAGSVSDPRIAGKALTLNERPVTVIGVLPETFDYATIFTPGQRVDGYSALPMTQEINRQGNTITMLPPAPAREPRWKPSAPK